VANSVFFYDIFGIFPFSQTKKKVLSFDHTKNCAPSIYLFENPGMPYASKRIKQTCIKKGGMEMGMVSRKKKSKETDEKKRETPKEKKGKSPRGNRRSRLRVVVSDRHKEIFPTGEKKARKSCCGACRRRFGFSIRRCVVSPTSGEHSSGSDPRPSSDPWQCPSPANQRRRFGR
jgi:hypothetical protein